MASVNKVVLIGNLGADPEQRYFPSGDAVTNFSIATTDTWKDKATGEKREATEWHRIITTGRLAEVCAQYLTKGSQVYVEGSLRTRKWTDKDGVERYSTEIRADTMKMLGSRPQGSDGGQQQRASSDDYARASGRSSANSRPAQRPAPSSQFDDLEAPF